jgi:hypothetical protein
VGVGVGVAVAVAVGVGVSVAVGVAVAVAVGVGVPVFRVKEAFSVMGPPIVIEAGLVVPEKEPVPLPVQLVKL